jgi:hypothetical protein
LLFIAQLDAGAQILLDKPSGSGTSLEKHAYEANHSDNQYEHTTTPLDIEFLILLLAPPKERRYRYEYDQEKPRRNIVNDARSIVIVGWLRAIGQGQVACGQ